jgi:glycosyltransferase involved in cell wall biosynthesis
MKISAFVITYNRPEILRACLIRARLVADELIVVEKTAPTGDTLNIAHEFADRVVRVPWTPVVEDTRSYAASLCTGDWVVCLDDDEILSADAPKVIRRVIEENRADVFILPIRNYILGRYDERAMPGDVRIAVYRRGLVSYQASVHAPALIASGAITHMLPGAWIDHLSHADTATWVEKTNRYTSQPNRAGAGLVGATLGEFAREAVASRFGGLPTDPYLEAVAALRVIYDLTDAVKRWEATQPNGRDAFRKFCWEVEKDSPWR